MKDIYWEHLFLQIICTQRMISAFQNLIFIQSNKAVAFATFQPPTFLYYPHFKVKKIEFG